MFHLRMKGTHYEAGYKWGKRLKEHDIHLMDAVPFELIQLRRDFASECHDFYVQYYPEIVEEIKGAAKGQGIDYQDLSTVLYSMYCIMPDQKCSCFIMKSEDSYLLCRNSDFLTAIEKLYMNVIYKLDDVYGFNGNTTAFVEMEDGMNEFGLAVGFTSIYPKNIKPGINAGMLVRYLLEKCKTVPEAIRVLRELPIASAQTLTLLDSLGNSVVVECDCDDIVIIEQVDKLVAVNAFYSDELKHKRNLGIDDWYATDRYETILNSLNKDKYSFDYARDILSGKYGFTCQYDRKTGKDTVWSVIYDTKNKKIYRCEGNPSRKQFKLDERK